MKVKVSEAAGHALNWLVAKAQGATNLRLYTPRSIDPIPPYWVFDWEAEDRREELGNYDPSEDWSLGGPIIEDEGILLRALRRPGHALHGQWLAMYDGENTGTMVSWVKREDYPRHYLRGPTPLIAAMRCFVSSELGDEVDVPEELR